MGTPQYIRLTARPRKREPAASEVKAIRFGNAAPSPTPVSRRASSSVGKLACQRGGQQRTGQTAAPTPTECAYARGGPPACRPPARRAAGRRIPALKIHPICILSSAKACKHADGGDPRRLQIQPFHQGHLHKTEPDRYPPGARGVAVVILVVGYLGDSRTNGSKVTSGRCFVSRTFLALFIAVKQRSSATSTIHILLAADHPPFAQLDENIHRA